MAFKTFAAGDVLTASDVNTFLMKQAVIVCTSSTRPGSPNEGMTIYETDTNNLLIYDGSGWVRREPVTVCTSASRPSVNSDGRIIYETDTNRLLYHTGSAWEALVYPASSSGWSPSLTAVNFTTGAASSTFVDGSPSVSNVQWWRVGRWVYAQCVFTTTSAWTDPAVGETILVNLPTGTNANSNPGQGMGMRQNTSTGYDYPLVFRNTSITGYTSGYAIMIVLNPASSNRHEPPVPMIGGAMNVGDRIFFNFSYITGDAT